MSTNFCVYPGKEYIPTFRELLDVSNKRMADFLSYLGIFKNVSLEAELREAKSDNSIKISMDDRMVWDEAYAWFSMHEIPGGTSSWFHKITELDKSVWQDDIKTRVQSRQLQHIIRNSLEIGYYWSFKRSAGQPGIVWLYYGLLAASLAKITEGFLYSDDGAWDYNCFPALPDDFFEWYLKPELSLNDKYMELAKKSIELIYKELSMNNN